MAEWEDRLRACDARWLARAISSVVEAAPVAEALLQAAYRLGGRARVVGITGPPGSGKSTLVDALARRYRSAEETVGIVAVDPTSPFTGGAILGDRIRMQAHHADPGIFIRSLATRGALGGLAQAAAEVVALLDAAGRQRILVETVGVGQDEVDIVQLADVTVVVLVPGMGDEEQAIKAMLSLAPKTDGAQSWRTPIVRTIATEGTGVEALQAAVQERLQWLEAHGGLRRHRARQWEQRLRVLARDRLAERVLRPRMSDERVAKLAEAIAANEQDPITAVDAIIAEALP